MQELDRKSFRIAEESSPIHTPPNLERMSHLLQQITIDLDHQAYCVLRMKRSQQKTAEHLQALLKEIGHLKTQILTSPLSLPKQNHIQHPKPARRPKLLSCMCFGSPTK